MVFCIEDESVLVFTYTDDCVYLSQAKKTHCEWYSSDTSVPSSAPTKEDASKASGTKVFRTEAAVVADIRRGLRGAI